MYRAFGISIKHPLRRTLQRSVNNKKSQQLFIVTAIFFMSILLTAAQDDAVYPDLDDEPYQALDALAYQDLDVADVARYPKLKSYLNVHYGNFLRCC